MRSAQGPRSICTRGRCFPRISTRAGRAGARRARIPARGAGRTGWIRAREPAGDAAPRRDNLPAELTTFIGREAELDALGGLLRRGPLVTVAGAAGCGKTRIALEAAARQLPRFQHGVWLVELGPISQPELIADAIAAAIGLKPGSQARAVAALVERSPTARR